MSGRGRFRPGNRAEVTSGSFAGLVGTVISADDGMSRAPEGVTWDRPADPDTLWLVLTIFGREVVITVRPDEVAPA